MRANYEGVIALEDLISQTELTRIDDVTNINGQLKI